MRPGFSVILLTTLIGAGQGLFLALYASEVALLTHALVVSPGPAFFIGGSAIVLAFVGAGAVASLFHLGHPERAWRALAMWRTSWLSREGIAILGFGSCVFLYGLAHRAGWPQSVAVGAVAAVLCGALFLCTGMIYACIRFLQEWASPLTVMNFVLLGCASGFTLAAAFAGFAAGALVGVYTQAAIALTLLGGATRVVSFVRISRIRHKSTLQSAIGIHHPQIVQQSQGFTGGSFNTREFFHRRSAAVVRNLRWVFILLALVLPLGLLAAGRSSPSPLLPCLAFIVQFIGLLAERWLFFAQVNHPQNLYYQTNA